MFLFHQKQLALSVGLLVTVLASFVGAQVPLHDEYFDDLKFGFRFGKLSSALSSASLFHHRCPSDQKDLDYWIIAGHGLIFFTYQDVLLADLEEGQGFQDLVRCERLYVRYDTIKEQLQAFVNETANRRAVRSNNLGLLRLNDAFFQCKEKIFSDGYCGIALGMPPADHEIIRLPLDDLLGDGSIGGDLEAIIGNNNRWSRSALQQSAAKFLEGRNTLDFGPDAEVWVVQQIHKIALGIDLSLDESKDLAQIMGRRLTFSILPKKLFYLPGFHLIARKSRRKMRSYLDLYDAAVRKLIDDGDLTSMEDEGNNVRLLSTVFFDAFTFAALPSVSGLIQGTLGAYYLGYIDNSLNITDTMDLSRMIMESVRLYPPVLGVPYVDIETGVRHSPCVGVNGYDEDVFGSDFLTYRVRLSFQEYQDKLLNWANAALPLDGKPETNHVCPAKALSFNFVLAFLLELDPTQWQPQKEIREPRPGHGPFFWSDFRLEGSEEQLPGLGSLCRRGIYS